MAYEVGNLGGGVAPSPSLTDALGKSQSFDPVDFSIGTEKGYKFVNAMLQKLSEVIRGEE